MAYVTSTVSTGAVNLAKYVLGGSGDNIVSDGYIKTVEKVWIDNYTFAFTNTLTAIAIAELPPNKKITSIEVDISTGTSQTSGTISIGYLYDAANVLATGGCSDFLPATSITHNLTRTTIQLPTLGLIQCPTATSTTVAFGSVTGFQKVTGGTQTTIAIKLNNWTMTAATGTIKTVVRYT
jgi:hypothetical protein